MYEVALPWVMILQKTFTNMKWINYYNVWWEYAMTNFGCGGGMSSDGVHWLDVTRVAWTWQAT